MPSLHFYCLNDVSLDWKGGWSFGCRQIRLEALRLRKRNWQGWLSWRRAICSVRACWDIWCITVSASTENEMLLSTQLSRTLLELSVLESAEPLSTNSYLLSQCQRNRLILPKPTAPFSQPTGCGGGGVLRTKKVRNNSWTLLQDPGSFKIYTRRGKEALSRRS